MRESSEWLFLSIAFSSVIALKYLFIFLKNRNFDVLLYSGFRSKIVFMEQQTLHFIEIRMLRWTKMLGFTMNYKVSLRASPRKL